MIGKKHRMSFEGWLGVRNARASLRNTDRDSMPDIIDCKPRNPRRQGIFSDIKAKLERYKAEAPQREQKKIESLERKSRMEEQYAKIENARARAREARARGYPKESRSAGLFGGGFGMPEQPKVIGVFGESRTGRTTEKKTIKRRKHKARRRTKKRTYFVKVTR